ncbi:MAG: hypothetical protein GX376_05650 [Firmicutes bacterium]|nr:hypothetical protein [Bacillota bacterium]
MRPITRGERSKELERRDWEVKQETRRGRRRAWLELAKSLLLLAVLLFLYYLLRPLYFS